MIDVPRLLRSFRFGLAGLAYVFRTEQNMRIHVGMAAFVIAAGWFFRISASEWLAVVFCIGAVIAAEAFNSAIERLADRVEPGEDRLIGLSKDAAAGAVLALAIASAAIGAIIFLPKILEFR